MKVLKHSKLGNIAYVSHVDTMRVLQRTLVRAGIKVKFSEGYNPHPITFCSHPLPLGVESKCEYFVIANEDMSVEEVLTAFNANIPSGMSAEYCIELAKNPNLARYVTYCEYFVECTDAISYQTEIEAMATLDECIVTYPFKDIIKTQDIAPLIRSITVDSQGIHFVVATGNPNLRPDRLTDEFNRRFGLAIGAHSICRISQLIQIDNDITRSDEYLKGLQL